MEEGSDGGGDDVRVDCQSDDECAQGRVCGTGTCSEPCSDGGSCTSGTCCDGRCVDLQRDIAHCGACGLACSADQFCSGTACLSVALSNVCGNPSATVLLDGFPTDDDAGAVIGAALSSGCAPPPTVRQVAAAAGPIAGSGLPLARGSELLVTAGGSYGQRLVDYVEVHGISAVFDSSDGTTLSLSTRAGGALFSAPRATVGAAHDYFVVELVREPVNGTLSLVVYGFLEGGTRAGAWYFVHTVLPTRAALTGSWVVVEWTDADGDLAPGAGDGYAVIASGS